MTNEQENHTNRLGELETQLENLKRVLQSQMPNHVVEDLKNGRAVKPERIEQATVMFTDIRNFTQIVDNYSPVQLVNILDRYFNVFDAILEKHEVRKIKTIGDSYMCASGLMPDVFDHALRVVLACLEMKHFIDHKKQEMIASDSDYMELRFGIHTGEVVAGMVGSSNKVYDLWGKTVNIAHRLEEAATVQSINISGSTYNIVWPFFDIIYRGKLPIKNKGAFQMYGVNGLKKEFRQNGSTFTPNALFWKRVGLHLNTTLRYEQFEKDAFEFIKNNLNQHLYYHCLEHTKQVVKAVDVICQEESLSDEEYIILKASAVLHDIGFVRSPERHEHHSVEIARQFLPNYGFSADQVDEVCACISSTKIGFDASNKLQQLLIDADLFYLGTNEYFVQAENLKEEFGFYGRSYSNKEWLDVQIDFLGKHSYFRTYAIKNLEPQKQRVLKKLKEERGQ